MTHGVRLVSGVSPRWSKGLLLAAFLSIAVLFLSSTAISGLRPLMATPTLGGMSYGETASAQIGATWDIASGAFQPFQVSFTSSGFRAVSRAGVGPAWELDMALTAYGYDDEALPLAPASLAVSGDLVQYRYGALTEWYVKDARGLEQGFTLSGPPSSQMSGVGRVRLDLSTSGSLLGGLNEQGSAVTFVGPDGAAALRYGGLHAYDSTGAELPSWLAFDHGRISIFVDDSLAVYPVTIDPLLTAEAKVAAGDPTTSKVLGASVAIDGAAMIAGAWGDSQDGDGAGAAYIFRSNGADWTQEAKLRASDAPPYNYFGYAVDISGNVAVVGAPGNSTHGPWSGAVYVFRYSGSGWAQEAMLLAGGGQMGDQFGHAVAISGNVVVVGAVGANSAAGALYVFRYNGASWIQEDQIVVARGTARDMLGVSVAIDDDTIIAGAQGRSDNGPLSGAAYVFRYNGSAWPEEAMLLPDDGYDGDMFGAAVAVNGDTVVIGAPFTDVSATDSGAAYVFVRSGSTWSQQAKLAPINGAPMASAIFGYAVSVEGDTAVVASVDAGVKGPNAGAAFLFGRSGTDWVQDGEITASDAQAGDEFGRSVDVQGATVVVGAHLADAPGVADTGAVYVYTYQIVANAPPVVSAGGPYTVKLGASVRLAGTASDPDGDPLVYNWDMDNNGTFETSGPSISFSTVGLTALSTHTVTVRACDPSGACSKSSTTVSVTANNPPAADAGGPYTVAEGASISLAGSGSDPDGDTVTFQWDLNYNGIFETPPAPSSTGQAVTFPPVDVYGVGQHGVRLRVCDTYDACAVVETVVTITNMPPTNVTLTVTTPLDENGLATLSGGFTDPGSHDTHTVSIDWGDGSPVQVLKLSADVDSFGGVTHQYADNQPDNAPYTIGVTVTDMHGGAGSGATSVVVHNVAPSSVTLIVTTPISEGGSTTLEGAFADPGALDTHTVAINWGDGAPAQSVNLAAGVLSFSNITHQYVDNMLADPPYLVSVTVTDKDGSASSGSTAVVVQNIAPSSVALTATTPIGEGGSATLEGSFSDVGTRDTHTVSIDWGDGSPVQSLSLAAGVLNFGGVTHQYLDNQPADAPYLVSVAVTDKDGGSGGSSTTVVVSNVAPTVSAGGPYAVVEGAATTLTGAASDPGSDTLTYSWDLDNDGSFERAGQTAAFPPAGVDAVGPHTVYLQVCDDDGACAVGEATVTITAAPQLPALAYALLGTGKDSVKVGVQSTVSGGLVGGNGDVDLLHNSDVGDVLAGGDVSVGVKAAVGNITAGGKVRAHKSAETGTVVGNATVQAATLPAVNANPDKKKDLRRTQRDARSDPLDLAPGQYGDLDSVVQDHIVLHGGEYHFNSISIDAKSSIRIDLTNGEPLVVMVFGNIKFGVKVQMAVVGGSAADIVFLAGGKEVRLLEGGAYLGTFVAPDGEVSLGVNATLSGSAWGKSVQTLDKSVVSWVAFGHAGLLGPASISQDKPEEDKAKDGRSNPRAAGGEGPNARDDRDNGPQSKEARDDR